MSCVESTNYFWTSRNQLTTIQLYEARKQNFNKWFNPPDIIIMYVRYIFSRLPLIDMTCKQDTDKEHMNKKVTKGGKVNLRNRKWSSENPLSLILVMESYSVLPVFIVVRFLV